MTYKEFYKWCQERTCDGHWGFVESALCISVISDVEKAPFWKKKRIWEQYRDRAEKVVEIVSHKNEVIEG